ncbi:putative calpain family cysteine protease [Rosellinia necatrix]|uniref:Putative calpain family cysteine protease n=1 Tax=Rosellinia necatrix TaxID=77044 RepID=A0A1S8A6W8_ROSNE|nr:putative calpain family cysteine protease [Rosellinia necatrix]
MQARRDRHYHEVKDHKKHLEHKEKVKAKRAAKKAAKAAKAAKDTDTVQDIPEVPIPEPTASADKQTDPKVEEGAQTIPPAATSEPDSGSKQDHLSPETTVEPQVEGTGESLAKQEVTSEAKVPDGTVEKVTEAPNSSPEPQKQQEEEEEEEETSDAESEVSSVSEISDTELEIRLRNRADSPPPPPPPAAQPGQVESEDEFESNPWNAVATVGLRVYYKISEEDKDKEIVTLRVVRPNRYAQKDGDEADGSGDDGDSDDGEPKEDAEESEKTLSKGLDVDDSAKDATLAGDQEQKKKSILSGTPR